MKKDEFLSVVRNLLETNIDEDVYACPSCKNVGSRMLPCKYPDCGEEEKVIWGGSKDFGYLIKITASYDHYFYSRFIMKLKSEVKLPMLAWRKMLDNYEKDIIRIIGVGFFSEEILDEVNGKFVEADEPTPEVFKKTNRVAHSAELIS